MDRDRTYQNPNKHWQPLYYALILVVGLLLGRYWANVGGSKPFAQLSKMEQIMELVREQYVDTVDNKDLEERAINKFLHSFDPHSLYIPAKDVTMVNQELKGSFEGIGVEFYMVNDTPYVGRVFQDGPADKAGLQPADRIVKADTNSLLGLQSHEVVKLLKGKKQSEVVLSVWRKHQNVLEKIKVKRGQVLLPTVKMNLINDSTIWVEIAHFAEPTYAEFTEQFDAINHEGITQIVMDLRNNPGGYLQVAVQLLDEFIDSEQTLAYTLGKGQNKKNYNAQRGGRCTSQKLICLINERSASASEIFSGAIQDLDRGLVVGKTTFGKGLVQETFHLNDESQVRLTVSRYYIPSGRSIQKPYDERGYMDEDSSTAHRVFETLGGRSVGANGGVEPDITIDDPVFSKEESSSQKIRFVDAHFSEIRSNSDAKAFHSNPEIMRLLEKDGVNQLIEREMLMSEIAYQFYGDQGWMYSASVRSYVRSVLNLFSQYKDLLNP